MTKDEYLKEVPSPEVELKKAFLIGYHNAICIIECNNDSIIQYISGYDKGKISYLEGFKQAFLDSRRGR